ncbi:MAG: GNAT family N-acetyltransferase [Anaerolineae bacterium]|nr:GNAT family N-acetyltransferase [Anaerolineae bacterium]
MTVRPFQIADAPHCVEIIHACVPSMNGLNAAAVRFVLDESTPEDVISDVNEGLAYVDILDDQVVGLGMLVEGEIKRMYVDPAYQGRGIGSRIMSALLDAAREQGLRHVRVEASLNGISFYERQGFVQQELEIFRQGEVEFRYMHMLITLED